MNSQKASKIMEKKIVIAKIQIIAGKEKEFLGMPPALIKATRNEPGNLAYILYQSTENPSEFLVYEEYKDEAAFNAHCASKAFQAFGKQAGPLFAKELEIQSF
jgi:quinol monooxygenase YgiN